jgi:hypothetical protein
MNQSRSWCLSAAVIIACLVAASAAAQTAREVRGAAAVEPLQNEPPAKIVIDPPLAESLSHGRVVIQYRAENLHIVPAFGPAALAVSPRIGHIHVTVDDASWVWADASGEPVILNGLPPGPHKVRIQLETANHQLLDQGIAQFAVPEAQMTATSAAQTVGEVNGAAVAPASQNELPAKIIVDPPQADRLARGVAFIQYRAENLQILPVYGPAALAVSPRVGHIHVTVDDATWHWADASGNPIILQGLAPGPHKVLIELVNANHQPLDKAVITFTIPSATQPGSHH